MLFGLQSSCSVIKVVPGRWGKGCLAGASSCPALHKASLRDIWDQVRQGFLLFGLGLGLGSPTLRHTLQCSSATFMTSLQLRSHLTSTTVRILRFFNRGERVLCFLEHHKGEQLHHEETALHPLCLARAASRAKPAFYIRQAGKKMLQDHPFPGGPAFRVQVGKTCFNSH